MKKLFTLSILALGALFAAQTVSTGVSTFNNDIDMVPGDSVPGAGTPIR